MQNGKQKGDNVNWMRIVGYALIFYACSAILKKVGFGLIESNLYPLMISIGLTLVR